MISKVCDRKMEDGEYGKKQTFIVEIQDTQYDSWQGSIEWVQGQKKQAFRSTMELLRLIDSVTRDKDENWQEK